LRKGERGGGQKREEGKMEMPDKDKILTTGFVVGVQGFHYQSVGPLKDKKRHTECEPRAAVSSNNCIINQNHKHDYSMAM